MTTTDTADRTPREGSALTGSLQMWGGLECTVNRVHDRWANQASRSGHDRRAVSDIAAFDKLGLAAVRYPALWEVIAPDSLDDPHWEATDEALGALEAAAMEPIIGLLHHGSGPHYTSLVDIDFPEKLAEFATLVATRYPWVTYYTPVNEPLTTSRFSGLYGVWYPHGTDDKTFTRALYNEVRGTVLAMRAIRAVNPDAQLMQTDDLGRAVGTENARAEVDFQNNRRWLTFDLLFGRVVPGHPLYQYLTETGDVTPDELAWLAANPCPPSIIGVNHYLLSNRFLDDDLEQYPADVINREGPVVLADVPAVQSAVAPNPSVEDVLSDVWARYGNVPFAVTEVHIDGDPTTQLQWLWEVWSAARRLREQGAPVVAVTAWSLLGTYDWNTLCTSLPDDDVHYEPGVFDVSSGELVETELSSMVQSLADAGGYEHPAFEHRGYWHHENRFRYGRPTAGTIGSPQVSAASLTE